MTQIPFLQQITNLAGYHQPRNGRAGHGVKSLQSTARDRQNLFNA